jgi:hypothetical protein
MQEVLMTRLARLLKAKSNMFFDPSKVESIKETMGLYFYHDLHKILS